LKQCGRCHTVRYCSSDCQRKRPSSTMFMHSTDS
jgi:radical SAM protein with 4Fe4S-binding SPASM domain